MNIGIISDTHGNILLTHQAMLIFREFNVERIIHCGDIGSVTILSQFAGTPTDFVLGNCDRSEEDFKVAVNQVAADLRAASRVTCHGMFGHIMLAEQKIAFMHGHDLPRLDREVSSGRWDMLCYGHTHKPVLWGGCDQTVVLNPGALHHVATPSVAVVKLPEREVIHVNLT